MSEIRSEGYQSLRDFANSSTSTPAPWDYIAVYDDAGAEVTRVSITGDSRAQWLDVDGDRVLKVEFEVAGGDADITTPVTLEFSAIWDAASGGRKITPDESFPTATLNSSGDTVTVTHTIEIPQA